MAPIVLQDKGESSGICMRVLDVRQFDKETPILIVVFNHDSQELASRASFDWISSYVVSGEARAMANITATVHEQQLLLRLLNQNKKRLISTYNPNRAPTESVFTLSFLLPVGPLGMQDMAKFNANNGCSICGEPAKQKCSRCGAVRYCDAGNAVCQKDDWKSHRPLCNKWQNAKWQGLTFVSAHHPIPNAYALRLNRYDNVQHFDAQKRLDDAVKEHDNEEPPQAPVNTHGTTPFIVKVQLNSSQAKGPAHTLFPSDADHDGSGMLIYDQRRTLEGTVLRGYPETTSFEAVAEVVKKRGDRGIKAFFWAVRTGEWTIDVCLDQAPEWQLW
ncbi:hypothetical protein DFH06DRAFT_1215894 [Mycena polygramma]|nr:hypothetical protein DFH06DRAFT_1215894 [Mycena polygramma]